MKTPPAAAPKLPVHQMLQVHAGQSQMLYWPAGTVVSPLRGGVWLSETPRWLGEQLLRPRCRVEAHATHVLAEAGWVVVWAEVGAVLRIVPGMAAPSGWGAVVQPARGLIAASIVAAWRKAGRIFGRGPARLA
ncbi:hypothetical protein RD110_01630 [Rhodoferax koreense]|uniref:DUF2917 domain-containing protein n=1 Tax=Rhodoferax koreensis TaxID=1842727 RepID=A0A1P8JQQ8_9BURK|nr:hypothetical protein [Rhodoferax koreense]APW36065.1 hypothetical protein RD110_01630 [Rhodoferax koreense]